MLKLVQTGLVSPIQVSAEVNKALKDNTVVVITKSEAAFNIYAGQGKLENGQIKEEG